MAVAAQQGRGRIKDLLLGKAGSFFSDPKDLPGLQTLKKKKQKTPHHKKPKPQKTKAKTSSFHYIILIVLTPRNTQKDTCQEPPLKERLPSMVGLAFTLLSLQKKKKKEKYNNNCTS